MKIGFLFPGQGSQVTGMGKDIYDKYEVAKDVYDQVKKVTGIDVADITFNQPAEILGKQFEYYDEINSTQKEIWKRINCNQIENGTVICAGVQTNGIGTHGRVWHTDEKNNIAFSFFINANTDVKNLDGITIEIARIVLQVFKNFRTSFFKFNLFKIIS